MGKRKFRKRHIFGVGIWLEYELLSIEVCIQNMLESKQRNQVGVKN